MHVEEEVTGFPEHDYEVRSVFSTGDRAAAEIVFSGIYAGAYPGLPPGAGQAISLPVAAVFTLDGETIRHETHYYDTCGFLIQLGVLPAPGMEGTPTP